MHPRPTLESDDEAGDEGLQEGQGRLGHRDGERNGVFTIRGCVLLFNGKPQGGKPTLQVFTRVQASNPSTMTCANPASNTQGNATILLTGVLKEASSPYGQVLDVNHITQSASFPLEIFKTTIGRGTTSAPGARPATRPGT